MRFLIAFLSIALTATFFAFSLVVFLVLLAIAVPLVAFFLWRLRSSISTAASSPNNDGVIEADYVVLPSEEPVEQQRNP
jgi:uncharacterized SAM-binding protein YcdF (DUF218 family)